MIPANVYHPATGNASYVWLRTMSALRFIPVHHGYRLSCLRLASALRDCCRRWWRHRPLRSANPRLPCLPSTTTPLPAS
jgi:hypothetical protein